MGMRGLGRSELCRDREAEAGNRLRHRPVHLELLVTVERVYAGEGRDLGALPVDGITDCAHRSHRAAPFLRGDVRLFGPGGAAFVDGFEVHDGHSNVRYDIRGTKLGLRFNFTARHQADNAAAALLAYEALGLPLERAQEGADRITFSRWRGRKRRFPAKVSSSTTPTTPIPSRWKRLSGT